MQDYWRNGSVESNIVPKYQPGISVIVNVMMLAFISKPHRAEFLLFFYVFRVFVGFFLKPVQAWFIAVKQYLCY